MISTTFAVSILLAATLCLNANATKGWTEPDSAVWGNLGDRTTEDDRSTAQLSSIEDTNALAIDSGLSDGRLLTKRDVKDLCSYQLLVTGSDSELEKVDGIYVKVDIRDNQTVWFNSENEVYISVAEDNIKPGYYYSFHTSANKMEPRAIARVQPDYYMYREHSDFIYRPRPPATCPDSKNMIYYVPTLFSDKISQNTQIKELQIPPYFWTKSTSFKVQEYNVCSLPMERGDCKEKIESWYYDPLTEKCRMFEYSGCGGNNNNFPTEKDCILSCYDLVLPE